MGIVISILRIFKIFEFQIQVLEPKKLAFDNSHPTLLTTQPDKQFVFPVHVQANQTQKYLGKRIGIEYVS